MEERKPAALYVDRESFIAWTQGILLDYREGRGVVGDHVDHEKVEQVLREGGRVFLTVGGGCHERVARDGTGLCRAQCAVRVPLRSWGQ